MNNLKFSDLELFLQVVQEGSLREVARKNRLQPSQISKTIRKVEKEYGKPLLVRSSQGMILTPDGESFTATAQTAMKSVLSLRGSGAQRKEASDKPKIMSIGAPTFISSSLITPALPAFQASYPNLSLRLISLAQDQMVSTAIRGFIDVALHVGEIDWPRSWSTVSLGKFPSGLFAHRDHPLRGVVSVKDLESHPFVVPVQVTKTRVYHGSDGCPLSIENRTIGAEASSADLGLSMITQVPFLAFLPRSITQTALANGLVRELKVKEWGEVYSQLYVSVRSDRVTQSLQRFLVKNIRIS